MKRGFELLQTRPNNMVLDFGSYESRLGFEVPSQYKVFHTLFLTGKSYPFKTEKYFDEKTNEFYYCITSIYEPLQNEDKWFLSLSYLYDLETVVSEWENYLSKDEEWIKYNFLKIANIGRGGGLFLSTRSEDIDAIYQVVWDYNEPYFKVANNIFEFIKGFNEYIPNELLQIGIKPEQLYKNWGEDFWRIREDKSA